MPVARQAYSLVLFAGFEVARSFHGGVSASYRPSLPDIMAGLGGVALALAIAVFAMKVLRLLPTTLADAAVDPHHERAAAYVQAADKHLTSP